MNLIKVTKKSMMGLTDTKKLTPSLTLYFVSNETEDFKLYQEAYELASKDKHYHIHGFEVEFEVETNFDIISEYFNTEINKYQKTVDEHTRKIVEIKNAYEKIIEKIKNEDIKNKKKG